MFSIPDEHYEKTPNIQDFADFAADPKNTGQIFEAPKSLWGHTIKFLFKKDSQARYQEFLEGLRHTFGEEVFDTSITLEERKIAKEPSSLPAILVTHVVDSLLETLKPVLNKQLRNIQLDLSIPEDPTETLPHPQGWVSQLIRQPVTEALQDTKKVLNRDLKNVTLDLSIRETPPPDHPLAHRQLNDAIQKNYTLFINYVTYLRYASLATLTINTALQGLKAKLSENFSEHDEELFGYSNEIAMSTQQKAAAITAYSNDLAKTLHLHNTDKPKNELTLFLQESSQVVAQKLGDITKCFSKIKETIISLENLRESGYAHLTSFSDESLIEAKETVNKNLQAALQKATRLIGISSTIVHQFEQKLQPHRQTDSQFDSPENSIALFCEVFEDFIKISSVLQQTENNFTKEYQYVLNAADVAVEAAKKSAEKAKTIAPIFNELSTFAMRNLHRTRAAKENLEAIRAQNEIKTALAQQEAIQTMFGHLLPATSSIK